MYVMDLSFPRKRESTFLGKEGWIPDQVGDDKTGKPN
jgi:hypothetical protein